MPCTGSLQVQLQTARRYLHSTPCPVVNCICRYSSWPSMTDDCSQVPSSHWEAARRGDSCHAAHLLSQLEVLPPFLCWHFFSLYERTLQKHEFCASTQMLPMHHSAVPAAMLRVAGHGFYVASHSLADGTPQSVHAVLYCRKGNCVQALVCCRHIISPSKLPC